MRGIVLLSSIAGAWAELGCSSELCPERWRGDGFCDPTCMTAACGYDSDGTGSDCAAACAALGCGERKGADPLCRAACSYPQCGWDGGQCGVCAAGCTSEILGDGVCDFICDSLICEYDSGDCVLFTQGSCASGCFSAMLGNGICESECLTASCENDHGDCDSSLCSTGCYPYFLSDGICQEVCHTADCGWDGVDCDCAPGCTTDLRTNSVCDAVCDVRECSFDDGQCVIYIQGDCASGCFFSMLENGVCDPECNVKECNYDELLCGCAVGCTFSDLGVCKPECLVAKCNFDAFPGYLPCPDSNLSRAAMNYALSARIFTAPYDYSQLCTSSSTCSASNWNTAQTACSNRCNVLGCAYSQGHCVTTTTPCIVPKYCSVCEMTAVPGGCLKCSAGYKHFYLSCVVACPTGFAELSFAPDLCHPITDLSDPSSPFEIFVQSQMNSDGTGAYENPFDNVAAALDAVSKQHVVIYLLSGDHILSKCKYAPYLLSWAQEVPAMSELYSANVTISGYFCEVDRRSPSNGLCATSLPRLVIDNLNPVKILTRGSLTLRGFELWGGTTLLAGCTSELCTYCPKVTAKSQVGLYVDDQGNDIEGSHFAPDALCAPFRSQRFIAVDSSSSLTLHDISFSNFRQGFRSLIYFTEANVTLFRTNFTNIVIGMIALPTYSTIMQLSFDAVIVQENLSGQSFINCTLVLNSVRVSLLNNGYEYNENLSLGGFLSVQGLRSVTLTHSWFGSCLCFRSALININNFLALNFTSTSFDTIYSGMFLMRLAPSVLLTDPAESAVTHLMLRDIAVRRCATALPGANTSGIAISLYIRTSLMNILFDNLTISDTFSQGTLIYLRKLEAPTASDIFGSIFLTKIDGNLLSTPVSKKTAILSGINIVNSYVASTGTSSGLINLYTLANVRLVNVTIRNSGDASGVESINSKAFAHLASNPDTHLSRNASGLVYTPCTYTVLLRTLHNTFLDGVTMVDTRCLMSGIGGVATAGTFSGYFEANNLLFQRVSGQSLTLGVCLHVVSTGAISISNLWAGEISAYKTGCVSISTLLDISMSDVTFTNSEGDAGLLQLLSFRHLSLLNSAFRFLSSEAGVTLMPIAGGLVASAQVKNCVFEDNQGMIGTGMYMSGDVAAMTPLTLQMENCDFRRNVGTVSGTGVYIGSGIALSADSSIRSCRFLNNTVNEAALFLAFSSGRLTIAQVECSGSALDPSAPVASLSSVGCVHADFKSSDHGVLVIRISQSVFRDNAGVSAISITSATGQALLESASNAFERNAGRAISIERAMMTDTSSVVALNGRVGYYLSNESTCSARNVSFLHSRGEEAGAIYLGGASNCNLLSCTFYNNSAKSNGAIYVEQASMITIDDCFFHRNIAPRRGAAISLFGSMANSWIRNSVFDENESGEGGTILSLSSSITLTNVTIRNNRASFAAGVLAFFSTVLVSQSVFQNQVSGAGSFVHASIDSNIALTGCEFSNGTAANEGGAIYLLSALLTVQSSTFFNVTAHRGACLSASSSSTFTIQQSFIHFAKTDAALGGVVYSTDSSATIINSTVANFRNSGIVSTGMKKLNISNTIFKGSIYIDGWGRQGAGLYCSDCESLTVIGTYFTNLTAAEGAAVYAVAQQVSPSTYHFANSRFHHNVGHTSGATHFEGMSVEIVNSTFLNNSAVSGSGGAVSLKCESSSCAVHVTSCAFQDNRALVQGGSVSWSDIKPVLTSNTFVGGAAAYGQHFASYPVSLSIKAVTGNATRDKFGTDESSIPVEATLHYVGSGQTMEQTVSVALLDHYGQVVLTDSRNTATLLAHSADSNVVGNVSATAVNGVFTFKGFGVSATPGTTTTVYVISAIVEDDINMENRTNGNKVAFNVEMRECAMGESRIANDCILCPEGKFSFNPAKNCEECLSEAICYGNYTMVPKKGYWRSSAYSPQFFECPHRDACVGSPAPPDPISLTGLCASGYYGNLCNGCLSGYSRQNQVDCLPCPSIVINIIRLGGIALGVLIALIVIVRTSINSARKQRSLYSIFIKILLNYLQLVMLTAAFQMKWPSYMKELFKVQQSAGNVTEQIFAVDCFFSTGSNDAQAIAVRMKLVGIAAAPVFIIGLALLIWGPVALYQRRMNYLRNELMTTIVVCFFLVHPSIVKFMFSFMYCRELESGQFWMNDYLNIPCWDFVHSRYVFIVAIPSIAGWGIGVPMVCLLVLYRNKNRLSLIELKLRFGFVYNGYEIQKYYWEFVILYRKILIITVAVFLTNVSTSIQALTVMMLLIGAFLLQLKHKPFAVQEMNDLELRGILVSAVTIYCGLYYMTEDLDSVSQVIMFVIVLTANAYFLMLWSVRVFHAGFQVLKRRCPCLFRCFGIASYRVQAGEGLHPVKVGSSVSRSFQDSSLVDAESVDLSRIYNSESLSGNNAQRRLSILSEIRVPDNSGSFTPEKSDQKDQQVA